MTSKRILNQEKDRVQESLEGLSLTVPFIRLLDGFPKTKVAYRETSKPQVVLISGGGSGHEPAFAGYIGDGMLNAAACGDIFAAPSADSILSAIQTVTGPQGCLLLSLNYTGDRLNFGLAAEQAKLEGYKVEIILVGEDCGVGINSRRGLAGVVFVMKILGSLARSGMKLEDLVDAGNKLVKNLGTVGVGLDTCALPGQLFAPRLNQEEVELGLGIHGEPGKHKIKQLSSDVIVDQMLETILNFDSNPFSSSSSIGLLVNDLGSIPIMDLNAFANRAVCQLERKHCLNVLFCGIGTFVTSITVSGFSLTMLKMEDGYLELLKSPTEAPAWTLKNWEACKHLPKTPLPIQKQTPFHQEALTSIGELYKCCLEAAVATLIDKEEELNLLDSKVGDGDCGTTLVSACQSIKKDMESAFSFNLPSEFLKALSESVSRGSGGTTGALYNICFVAAAAALAQEAPAAANINSKQQWTNALEAGIRAIEKHGGAQAGDRTMLDALIPVLDTLRDSMSSSWSLKETLEKIKLAVREGADSTAEMIARAGRSSYVTNDATKGIPDPGAKAVEYWIFAVMDLLYKKLC